MGCLKAQGYFYGLPEDADGVRTRLRAAGRLAGAAEAAPPADDHDIAGYAVPLRQGLSRP
jgi:hypothetical protein